MQQLKESAEACIPGTTSTAFDKRDVQTRLSLLRLLFISVVSGDYVCVCVQFLLVRAVCCHFNLFSFLTVDTGPC